MLVMNWSGIGNEKQANVVSYASKLAKCNINVLNIFFIRTTSAQMHVNAGIYSSNHVVAAQYSKWRRYKLKALGSVHIKHMICVPLIMASLWHQIYFIYAYF